MKKDRRLPYRVRSPSSINLPLPRIRWGSPILHDNRIVTVVETTLVHECLIRYGVHKLSAFRPRFASVKVRHTCHEHIVHHFYAMAGAIASYSPIIAHSRRSVHVFRYEMTRGLICSIRTPRLVSAAASSFVASFAVLLFEPHTTKPLPGARDRTGLHRRALRPEQLPRQLWQSGRLLNLGGKFFGCAPRGGRSPRGDPHLLGFLDWPKPCRSSDAAGVPVCSPNDPCSNPIRECVLPDQFGKPVV